MRSVVSTSALSLSLHVANPGKIWAIRKRDCSSTLFIICRSADLLLMSVAICWMSFPFWRAVMLAQFSQVTSDWLAAIDCRIELMKQLFFTFCRPRMVAV